MLRDHWFPSQPVIGRRNRWGRLFPLSLGWMLVAYAALVIGSGWAYSALRIRTDRELTLQMGRNRLRAVSGSLETGTLAMLNDGVGAAIAGANEIEAAGGLRATADASAARTLARMLTGGDYVRSMFMADSTRFVRAARGGRFEASQAVPAWFTALQASNDQRAWVGKPIPDPDLEAGMVVPIALRVETDPNRHVWAGALFDFGQYKSLLQHLGVGAMGLALVATDGTLLVFIPGRLSIRAAAGGHVTTSKLFQQMENQPDSGFLEGFAPNFGTEAIFAYDRVNGYPMTVVTGEPVSSMLESWRERRQTTIVVTAASTVLLLIMTTLLHHYVRALFRREAHYRALFNNSAFSVLILEGHRFVDANDTVAKMFGLKDRNSALGMSPWELSPDKQPDGRRSVEAARDRIGEALREGGTRFEWLHRRRDTGEVFSAEVALTSVNTDNTTLALAVVHDLTERKRAEQNLTESEHRYRALLSALPEGVFVHRGDELLFANDAAVKLLGAQSLADVLGQPVLSFLAEESRHEYLERNRWILESGCATEPREVRLRRLDGSYIWVESHGVRITYGGAPAIQGMMHDVTARRQREQFEESRTSRTQRQSTALLGLANRQEAAGSDLTSRLRAICGTAADVLDIDRVGTWLLEDGGRSLRCRELYDRSLDQHIDGILLSTSRFPRFLEIVRTERVIEAERIELDSRMQEIAADQWMAPAASSVVAAAIRLSGELAGVVTFAKADSPRAWYPDEVTFAGGIADQIAQAILDWERECVLADLRVLAGELMRTQDEERRRVGRELHDSTGQTLIALELGLTRLAKSAGSLPSEQLSECIRLASLCSAEIRTASYLLHPPLLDELGLVSALRWLADGLRERSGIEVRLNLPDSIPRMRSEEELVLFRVAQEALTNAQRHSGSPWVAVRLQSGADSIDLEVEDGGRGIAGAGKYRAGVQSRPLGVGLAGMRARIQQVGGTLSVDSTDTGTRVRATIQVRSWAQVRSA